MSVLIFLVPIALLLAGVALAGFIYAVKSDQYEDCDTPPCKALLDDSPYMQPRKEKCDDRPDATKHLR